MNVFDQRYRRSRAPGSSSPLGLLQNFLAERYISPTLSAGTKFKYKTQLSIEYGPTPVISLWAE